MDELMTLLEEMALRMPSRVVLGHIFCWLVEITEITTNGNNRVRCTLAVNDDRYTRLQLVELLIYQQ